MRAPVVAGALLLIAQPAIAQETVPRPWSAGLSAAYVILGPEGRRTGGLMPALAVRRIWALSDAVQLGVGVRVGAFGFADETRWLGWLGGLAVEAEIRPARSAPALSIPIAVRLEGGRVPVCNSWGLCLRFVGLYPALETGLSYRLGGTAAVSTVIAARYVRTLAWEGVSVEPALGAQLSW